MHKITFADDGEGYQALYIDGKYMFDDYIISAKEVLGCIKAKLKDIVDVDIIGVEREACDDWPDTPDKLIPFQNNPYEE
jgi:hypothetical protein